MLMNTIVDFLVNEWPAMALIGVFIGALAVFELTGDLS